MKLGKRLWLVRKARQMTQQQVADRTSEIGGVLMSQQAYQKLEKKDSDSSSYLFAMAKTLGVNPEWLQTGQGESGLHGAEAEQLPHTPQSTISPVKIADKRFLEVQEAWAYTTTGVQDTLYTIAHLALAHRRSKRETKHKGTTTGKGAQGTVARAATDPVQSRPAPIVRSDSGKRGKRQRNTDSQKKPVKR